MKKHIPNGITLLNLFCGIIAVIYASHFFLNTAFYWIIAGLILDFFDGFIARILKVASPLGVQLDSLADVVTFGVAPSMFLFQLMTLSLGNSNLPSLLISCLPFSAFLVALASAYRLAKFNIDTRQTTSFIGLPTPANALFIASLPLIIFKLKIENMGLNPEIFFGILFIITLISSYLLNSEIKLFALKFKSLTWKDNKIKFIFLGISALLISFLGTMAISIIIPLYILTSLIWKETI